jgi:hypothetical protein
MKKLMISIMFMLATLVSANAMNSRDARRAALFLTDKMAYELNLTTEQYQAVFEINYDYFLHVDGYDDIYGDYWSHRDVDLSFVLGSSKYSRFRTALYFYQPVYWRSGNLAFRIYSRYADRDRYYYRRPHYCMVYNGEHSWWANGGRSYYNRSYNDNRHYRTHYDDAYYNPRHGNKHYDDDRYFRGKKDSWGPKMKERGGHGKHLGWYK